MGWLSGWQYRKSHVINSASGAGTNYQVKIKAYYGSGTDSGENVYLGGKCRSDFGDVRFTDDDGTTLLDYWMESKVDSSYAIFWVEVADDLSSNSATIYIYYGKSDATTTSNGDATFLEWTSFETGLEGWTVKTEIWEQSNEQAYDGSYSAKAYRTSGSWTYPRMYKDVGQNNICITARIKRPSTGGDQYGDYGLNVRASATEETFYYARLKQATTPTGTPTVELYKFINGAQTRLSYVTGTGISYCNTWNKFSFAIYGSQMRFWINDALKLSSTNSEIASGYVGLMSYWNEAEDIVYFDYVYVRKYADPEPSHGSWGSEEQPSGQVYEISVDAVCQSLVTPAYETTYNISKDAAVAGQSLNVQQTAFNIEKGAMVEAFVDVIVEKVVGLLVEIFKDAIAAAQATFTLESTFNINLEAAAQTLTTVNVEAALNIVKDAITQAFAAPQVVGIYPINKDVLVSASAAAMLQQIVGIRKDAVVVAVSTPLIYSTFNITPEANVKVLAEVAIIKEGEVKVTRLFLVLGDLAIQIQGS